MDRLIAIDWSGNKIEAAQRRHIWMADWRAGVVTLSRNRTRQETIEAVIAAREETPEMVVGFDFAFSYPSWFLLELGCDSAADFWGTVQQEGPGWLHRCTEPFWGRPKTTCPPNHTSPAWRGFRATERRLRSHSGKAYLKPKSPFQIGGAGAVGTGSLRGIPFLLRLQAAGFSIWPFDEPRHATVMEVYPRIFAGPMKVSDADARSGHLDDHPFSHLDKAVLAAARMSPDAFDALCALMGMVAHAGDFSRLRQATSPDELLEGRIWVPGEM